MLKKPHVLDSCCRKNRDFNPTYHDWLDAHKTERERGGIHNERVKWVSVAGEREGGREIERERGGGREREGERERWWPDRG